MSSIKVESVSYSEMKPGDVLRYNVRGSSDFGHLFEVTQNTKNTPAMMLNRMFNLRSHNIHVEGSGRSFSYVKSPDNNCFDRILTSENRVMKLGLSNVLIALWLNLDEDLNTLLVELEI